MMIVERKDSDRYVEMRVYNEGTIKPWGVYRIICMHVDIDRYTDQRVPPTAYIALLSSTSATFEDTRRLAREYDYVADVAEALQAERRAAYDADHPAARGGE